MKKLLKVITGLSFIGCIFSCSPASLVKGTYFSNLGDTFIIEKTASIITLQGTEGQLKIKQRSKFLKLRTTWYPNTILSPPHKFDFKIVSINPAKIVLKPTSRWSKLMFDKRDSIVLHPIPRLAVVAKQDKPID